MRRDERDETISTPSSYQTERNESMKAMSSDLQQNEQ